MNTPLALHDAVVLHRYAWQRAEPLLEATVIPLLILTDPLVERTRYLRSQPYTVYSSSFTENDVPDGALQLLGIRSPCPASPLPRRHSRVYPGRPSSRGSLLPLFLLCFQILFVLIPFLTFLTFLLIHFLVLVLTLIVILVFILFLLLVFILFLFLLVFLFIVTSSSPCRCRDPQSVDIVPRTFSPPDWWFSFHSPRGWFTEALADAQR
mmetsp:Transcript_45567/g.73981  ORF Transcript_45567/g.73981 Transcript_45567/m.73981 type:complete len:209 (-) Transcript_45567:2262-2888(-)